MLRRFIRNNVTSVSILIFISIYVFLIMMQPAFLYNKDGSLRQFGLNSSKKTVIPAWLLALLISIFSYLFVLYYLAYPKIQFS
jgi:uncharacterized membrane protein